MITLWIFNPETDLVTGLDSGNYTPKKSIIEMRQRFSPVASLFALHGDKLLILDSIAPHPARYLDAEVISLQDLKGIKENYRISPWGWNRSLRNQLQKHGADPSALPSDEKLQQMRIIAHRNFTIPFNRHLGAEDIPVECKDTDTALRFIEANGGAYLKTPWSSSGKGNLLAAEASDDACRWIEVNIRRAGSVMAERICRDKVMDLASEWICEDGKPRFLGISVFNTDRDNRYVSNLSLPQEELMEMCRPYGIESWLDRQRAAIAELIAPHYNGPLGIDMMATKGLRMIPCVEINLRHTMGMASLCFHQRFPQEREFIPSRISSYLSR